MAIAFHSTFGILLTHQFRISKKTVTLQCGFTEKDRI